MQYTIENGILSVTADAHGAELTSVKKNGKEWVWQNPNGAWSKHGPLLFPVCGHCGVTVDGVSYPIKAHGFASKSEFSLTAHTENCLQFTLESNAETKEMYPYDFRFSVTYIIDGDVLTISYEVENISQKPIYFACGGHESFNVESSDLSGYEIRFEKKEKLVCLLHNNEGYMTDKTQEFGETDVFVLPDSFLQEGRTLVFKGINSRKVTLAEKAGKALVEVSFKDFPNLLFWRALNSPYICIEPWSCLPDPAGVADVEFSKKYGVMEVAVGEKKSLVRTIKYHG